MSSPRSGGPSERHFLLRPKNQRFYSRRTERLFFCSVVGIFLGQPSLLGMGAHPNPLHGCPGAIVSGRPTGQSKPLSGADMIETHLPGLSNAVARSLGYV